MCLFSCLVLYSFVLADIWQKLKFIKISLIKVRLFLLLTLLVSTWFSCCILIFCSLFIQDIYLRVSFLTLRTMFGLGLGGMYIDFYLFVLFSCVKKKKICCLVWGLCFEFVILLFLKEFDFFHAQFIAHARSHLDTTYCWRIKVIRKSWR